MSAFGDINADAARAAGRILTTPEHYAYLQHRGGLRQPLRVTASSRSCAASYRSRPMEELVDRGAGRWPPTA